MDTYRLVNPRIIGSFNSNVTAESSLKGAEKLWENLTKHITQNVPSFYFTIENVNDNSYHNFHVNESPEGKMANYSITDIGNEFKQDDITKLKKMINDVDDLETQNGGNRYGEKRYKHVTSSKDIDDSSSSDSDDDYNYATYKQLRKLKMKDPFSYWAYLPNIYHPVPKVFIPTMLSPLIPYVEIRL